MANLRRVRAILLSTLCAVLLAPSIPEFLAANADASFRPGSGIYRCRTEDEIVSGEIDPFYLCPPVDYPSPPLPQFRTTYSLQKLNFCGLVRILLNAGPCQDTQSPLNVSTSGDITGTPSGGVRALAPLATAI